MLLVIAAIVLCVGLYLWAKKTRPGKFKAALIGSFLGVTLVVIFRLFGI